jgi:hypothetical protein
MHSLRSQAFKFVVDYPEFGSELPQLPANLFGLGV